MNLEQLILGKIAEEASEIAKAALKAQQFGLDDCDPATRVSNGDWLTAEYHDLQGMFAMLNMLLKQEGPGFTLEATPWQLRQKIEKVCRWAQHSIKKDRLQIDGDTPEWLKPFWNPTE